MVHDPDPSPESRCGLLLPASALARLRPLPGLLPARPTRLAPGRAPRRRPVPQGPPHRPQLAAAVGRGLAAYYYFLAALGRRAELLAGLLLRLCLRRLPAGGPVLFALDDSPTQRYGPHVQGAGVHHNPTPGPTDQRFLYGHVW